MLLLLLLPFGFVSAYLIYFVRPFDLYFVVSYFQVCFLKTTSTQITYWTPLVLLGKLNQLIHNAVIRDIPGLINVILLFFCTYWLSFFLSVCLLFFFSSSCFLLTFVRLMDDYLFHIFLFCWEIVHPKVFHFLHIFLTCTLFSKFRIFLSSWCKVKNI